MGIVNVILNIKKIHPKDIAIIKIGNFYYVYGKDAFIISYIFKYKLRKVEEPNIYSCAFPKNSYNKVIAKLENRKINYIVIDRRNNYEIDEELNNKNLNNYDEIYEKAHRYINLKARADNIYNYIINNIEKDSTKNIIKKIEEILNEK
jgi:hypothetical protein